MTMTSVAGHLMEVEFRCGKGNWKAFDPIKLFDEPVEKKTAEKFLDCERNLINEARRAQWLVLWLDCDREGENIAFEVIQVCCGANPRLRVLRAHFSALIPRDIHRACETLTPPNERDAQAVDARQELDLRIGAAFTRLITLRYKNKFDGIEQTISFGPCQFPTLGFVVDRYIRIEAFEPEDFFKIDVQYMDQTRNTAAFSWKRGRLFDRELCQVLYDECMRNQQATVIFTEKREKRRWRPLPLTTVELQKEASRWLHIGSQRTMDIAEELYQAGALSYPRTETDQYPDGFDFMALIQEQTQSNAWGQYATELQNGAFRYPRRGQHNDNSHPPIHPVKFIDQFQSDEHRKVYEYIVRRYLACLFDDAVGQLTTGTINIAGETFTATGTAVEELNYLKVFTYERWTGNTIPVLNMGQTFQPTSIQMTQGRTSPPDLLSERELLALMDTNAIGTDATMASHIHTIEDRKYVSKLGDKFCPTNLGIALVLGFEMVDLNLQKPFLRAQMEADMKMISAGTRVKEEVVASNIEMMKQLYTKLSQNMTKLDEAMRKYFRPVDLRNAHVYSNNFITCGVCEGPMALKQSNEERFVVCHLCENPLQIPANGNVRSYDTQCPLCRFGVISVTGKQGKEYQICPQCFNHPPPEHGGDGSSFFCFKCTNTACALAKGAADGLKKSVVHCPKCPEGELTIRKKDTGTFLGCNKFPACKYPLLKLPRCSDISVLEEECPRCVHGKFHLLRMVFARGYVPPDFPPEHTGCVGGCDALLRDAMEGKFVGPPQVAPAQQGRPNQAMLQNTYQGLTAAMRAPAPPPVAQTVYRPQQQPKPYQQQQLGGYQQPSFDAPSSSGLQSASAVVTTFPERPSYGSNGGFRDTPTYGGGRGSNPPNTSFGSAYGRGAPGGADGSGTREFKCFRCGQDGHIAPSCPNKDQPSTSGGAGGSRACFNCGQEGHFSSACPQPKKGAGGYQQGGGYQQQTPSGGGSSYYQSGPGGTTFGGGYGAGRGSGSGSGGSSFGRGSDMSGVTCYKCQQPGHFASKCPNNEGGASFGGGGRGQSTSTRGRGNKHARDADGEGTTKKPRVCGKCRQPGHTRQHCDDISSARSLAATYMP